MSHLREVPISDNPLLQAWSSIEDVHLPFKMIKPFLNFTPLMNPDIPELEELESNFEAILCLHDKVLDVCEKTEALARGEK